MTSKALIIPCLWCKDDALNKAQYYCNIFPNSKITSQHPVIVTFELGGKKFQALNGGDVGTNTMYNDSISMSVQCENQAEVDYYWNKLIDDGGKEIECGWCMDKWGMRWQIIPKQLSELMMDPDPIKTGKVMQAMMKMQKIIVVDLEAAYNS